VTDRLKGGHGSGPASFPLPEPHTHTAARVHMHGGWIAVLVLVELPLCDPADLQTVSVPGSSLTLRWQISQDLVSD